ncbi:MAG: glutathione peroxidase [Gammaproteobacteria bacterium]|nr:MAG: glutathione peroxidase [Gammaproteobacteria bacterium]
MSADIYQFKSNDINHNERQLQEFEGKVLLIVNTASKCGFTPQYKDLEALYQQYKDQGFEVLAYPCNQFLGQEPGSSDEIVNFCEKNYGVSFPLFEKIDVNGDNTHPLFEYLKQQAPGALNSTAIKWNFTKFLVDQSGAVLKRYSPRCSPSKIAPEVGELLI